MTKSIIPQVNKEFGLPSIKYDLAVMLTGVALVTGALEYTARHELGYGLLETPIGRAASEFVQDSYSSISDILYFNR